VTATSTAAAEKVSLKVSDGTTMTCWVARPKTAARTPRGIIVFQEAFGVVNHIKDVAGRFAALGFTAIAPEMFHRTGEGLNLKYGDMDAVMPHMSKVSADTIAADTTAAFEWLKKDAGVADVAAAGYCMGGRCTFIANATVPLKAAASYYGGGIAQGLLHLVPKQHARIQFYWGGKDKNILPEHTRAVADAMTAAGKEFSEVTFSYAEHGFFCDDRPSYNKDASRQAWAMTQEYFRVEFGDPD